jgi:hypothetical protein
MQRIKIGWARRDVSTDKPINIPGQFHMRISKGISDPLYVNTLVLDDGKDIVIFISADLVVIRSRLLDEVREAVAKRNPEIPVEKIIMNATHTHSGASHYSGDTVFGSHDTDDSKIPDVGIEIASGDEYRHFLAEQSADAICEAYENRSEGGIAYGYGYAVTGHNRRVVYFDDISKRSAVNSAGYMIDGHGKMYGNTNDDNFSHYEGGADHFVNLLYTFDADNNLTGAIINVPCPSQNSEHEYMLTADYWHDVREAIRAKYGDIHILSQCAAGGDVSPRILHYRKAQERRFKLKYGDMETERAARKDIAERIAAAFDEVLSWAKKDIKTEVPIVHEVRTIHLTKRRITEEELVYAKKNLEKLEAIPYKTEGAPPEELIYENSVLLSRKKRLMDVIKRFEEQDTNPKLPMELHAVKVGDIAFATNRFELFMDYMHRIQARSPFEQTFVIQLTGVPGDEGGTYLATERAVANKGYSASLFCNVVSPEGGQELVEETLISLKRIKDL